MNDSGEIRKRVLAIKEINVLPRIAVEIEDAALDEFKSILNMEELIQSDIALSAMILKMANSAYYGYPRRIASVESAVAALGLGEVTLLALGVGAMDPAEVDFADSSFDLREFWIHCFSASWIARKLALTAGIGEPDEISAAALLHDLGKLAVLSHLKPEAILLRRQLAQGREFYQAESLLGLDHSLIGYWLAKKWGLPETITLPIRDHHATPGREGMEPRTALVVLANGLAKSQGFGLVHKEREADINAALGAAGLDLARLKTVARQARAQLPPLISGWRRVLPLGVH